MLIASEDMPRRKGYRYMRLAGGGYMGWSEDARPEINRKHIDGPLLYMRNGEMHWLTPWERLLLWLGKTDALLLEKKHRPHLSECDPRSAR